jgi:sugar phosphate isomerase/epimerase
VTNPAVQRLSLNQWTVRRWGVRQAIEGCLRHGIDAIGLWREPVADLGLTVSAALLKDAGLRVSSLCRGGFFNQAGWLDDNRAAIDEAATLGAACLVLVVGGLPDGDKDLIAIRAHMSDAIAALAPYAAGAGVRLALEPMHPMYCADRGVLCTLGQALDVAAPHPPDSVAVMIDTFHLWWDPDVRAQIASAGRERRIAGFQVGDFLPKLPADVLLGRAMMGDGVIDFGPLCGAVTAAGYTGDVEVEIFNADIWAADPNDVLTLTKERYASLIASALHPAH